MRCKVVVTAEPFAQHGISVTVDSESRMVGGERAESVTLWSDVRMSCLAAEEKGGFVSRPPFPRPTPSALLCLRKARSIREHSLLL